jgi:hypothetical protein
MKSKKKADLAMEFYLVNGLVSFSGVGLVHLSGLLVNRTFSERERMVQKKTGKSRSI